MTAVFYMNTLQAPPASVRERRSYIIILKNGQELPGFWEQRTELPNDMVRVELDTPWEPGTKMFKNSDVEGAPGAERPERRKDRIRKGWEERGYTEVNGVYYPKTEVELAQRARQMAGVTDKPVETELDAVEPAQETINEAVQETGAPDSSQGWKLIVGYVGVVGVAALFVAVVIRKMILPGA